LKTGNGRTIIPNDAKLRRDILDEAHQTRYTVHLGNNKMYQDLKNKFWWCGIKRHIAEYVAQCLSCQLVKAEHQRPAGNFSRLMYLCGSGIKLPWISLLVFQKHQVGKMLYG
jgi:hypothetical protein